MKDEARTSSDAIASLFPSFKIHSDPNPWPQIDGVQHTNKLHRDGECGGAKFVCVHFLQERFVKQKHHKGAGVQVSSSASPTPFKMSSGGLKSKFVRIAKNHINEAMNDYTEPKDAEKRIRWAVHPSPQLLQKKEHVSKRLRCIDLNVPIASQAYV